MANEVTVTTGAVFIPELWSSDILRVVEANLCIVPRVHSYNAGQRSRGDIVHVPSITEITTTAKSAGTDVTPTANTETEVQISLNQHHYAAVDIEDIAAKQSNSDLRAEYTKAIGYAVAKKMDISLAELFDNFSNTVGTAATALTDAVIVSAVQNIDDADAPMDDRHFFLDPQSKADILKLDKFVLFQNLGASPDGGRVLTGRLGEIYGAEVCITTNIQTPAGSPATEACALMHRDALGIAKQQDIRVQADYELRGLATLLVADAIWGVAEMRDTFGVYIKR